MSKGKRRRGKRKGARKEAASATAPKAADVADPEPEAEVVKTRTARESEVDLGWGDPDELSGPIAAEPEPEPEPEPALRREVVVPDEDEEDDGPGDGDRDDGGPPPEPAEVPPLAAALARIDRAVGTVELVAVSIFLAALIGTAVYQFIASKFFHKYDNWPFEVIRYSVFFIAMSAAALAAQQKKMMAIDFVPRLLSPRARAICRVVTGLAVVFVCYLLFRGALMVRESIAKTTEHYDVVDPLVGVLALPIGAGLIGFHFLVHALIELVYLGSGKLPPEEQAVSVH